MSAIAGIINPRGRPVERDLLERMAAAGAPFGPDEEAIWLAGDAGLVYRGVSLATAPQPQPLHDLESGLVVMLDGQVHARQQLRKSLAAAGHPCHTGSDVELLLRAYQCWGDRCPNRVLGEYAFSIWDSRRRRLFCARDIAGSRSLFYARFPDGSFRFATVAAQLLSDTALPRKPDLLSMVDFIVTRGGLAPVRTPLAAIGRLPAAHALVADDNGVQVSRYWSLDHELDTALKAGGDHVDLLGTALVAAVRDRLENCRSAAISLSGGYDSGALFLTWQWLRSQDSSLPAPLVSSYYWDDPASDEREDVRRLLDRWPAPESFLHLPGGSLLDGVEENTRQIGMPDPNFGGYWLRTQAAAVRSSGVHMIMSGELGNEVTEDDILRCTDLLLEGKPGRALAQLGLWSRFWGTPVLRTAREDLLRRSLRLLVPTFRSPSRHFRRMAGRAPAWAPHLSNMADELSEELLPAGSRRRELRLIDADARWNLERMSNRLLCGPAVERQVEGLEMTMPFMDRRVIVASLAGLVSETEVVDHRHNLVSAVRRSTGEELRGEARDADAPLEGALRADLSAAQPLMTAENLIGLGLIDARRWQVHVNEFRLGRRGFRWPLWTVASLEAWARCWLR